MMFMTLGGLWLGIHHESSSSPAAPSSVQQSPVPSPSIPISSISWSEVDAIYNLRGKYTDLQKDEFWQRYKGKKVAWSGKVSSVSEGFGSLDLQVKMNPDTFTSDLIIELKASEKSKALGLRVGDSVTFTGILDRWGSILPITLKQAEIQ